MFFFFKKKKIAKGLDRTVLTGSCGPIPVLTVHGINKKSDFLCSKNPIFYPGSWFSRSNLPIRFDSENYAQESNLVHASTSHLKTHGINSTNLYIMLRNMLKYQRGNLSTLFSNFKVSSRPRLVHKFKYVFSIFKQHYMYFHTLFHSQICSKKLKTIV